MKFLGLALFLAGTIVVLGAGREVAFDAANKSYEEGKYAEAASAYEKLLAEGVRSAALYFNLGTAHYRAGQMGRAVAAFRQAEELSPRDPSLRANLQFVRKKVSGEEKPPGPWWRSWLMVLTLSEGAVLAAVAWWGWCLLLALREWKPDWRPRLRGYTLAAGLLAAFLAAAVGASAYARFGSVSAVIIVKEAVARYGPLPESQPAYHLGDGAEVTVLDAKDNWVQLRDAAKRVGWVKRDQVMFLSGHNRLPSLK
jgi:tetratricopeptide (TPR) repeat protein